MSDCGHRAPLPGSNRRFEQSPLQVRFNTAAKKLRRLLRLNKKRCLSTVEAVNGASYEAGSIPSPDSKSHCKKIFSPPKQYAPPHMLEQNSTTCRYSLETTHGLKRVCGRSNVFPVREGGSVGSFSARLLGGRRLPF